jgi:hypothetical protein
MLPVPIIEKETPVDEGDDAAEILFDERYNEAEQ